MFLNKIQLIGKVSRDIEVRKIPNWSSVCTINLETNRIWIDQINTKQSSSEFHTVVLWWDLADIAEKFVKRDDRIYIEGRLQTRSWDDTSGIKRYKTEVVANNMIYLGASPGDGIPENILDTPAFSVSTPSATQPKKQILKEDVNLEDIPF